MLITHLLESLDPIIRYKALVYAHGADPQSPQALQAQALIPTSPIIQALLSDQDEYGQIPFHPYTKWQGAHWVLTCLADTGYPPGDARLLPLRDQVMDWLLSDQHIQDIALRTGKNPQVRLHASMEANAIYACLVLGLADERLPILVERLLWAQWEDGGWNCDRHARADTSSFFESITPLRALSRCAAEFQDARFAQAAARAAEVFLSRRLFKRRSDGQIMRQDFLKLHYPSYWYYDILMGLKVMAEAGFIHDPRCADALDLLEAKQLPGGGWAAEGRHYIVNRKPVQKLHRGSRTAWGVTHHQEMNAFITIDALAVLRQAGRLP